MLTSEQLSERTNGIGGSEIAAILGVADRHWKGTPYSDEASVLAVKTGQAPEFEGNQYTEWGNRLEPVIVDWYIQNYGGILEYPCETIWSPDIPFAFCTPDGIIDRESGKHGLEVKNRSYSAKAKWKEGPPEPVLAQVKWSMMVMGWERWDVAVLINGNDPRAYVIERDREWEAMALEKATAFWAKVEQANRELWG